MKKHKILRGAISVGVLFLCLFFGVLQEVKADQIKDPGVFDGADWSYVTHWSPENKEDVQSMCETDKYIVCFQDARQVGVADTITVFDRWSYQLLFQVKEMDYEHGNGMTYNPDTNEVLIAPYNSVQEENKGAVFVLDADTLQFQRRVYISDGSWNAASIEYVESSAQYIIQTTRQKKYKFFIFDADFNMTSYLFRGDQSMRNLFQDFCVSGDYIISIPWMRYDMSNPTLQIYSISQKTYLGAYSVTLPYNAGEGPEIESVCQSDAGEIVLAVAIKDGELQGEMALYNTRVPVVYTVNTAVENGEITESRSDIDLGSNYKVKYSSTEDYELKELQVDGQDVDTDKYKKSYTFGNIMNDHSIWALFTEIPKFDITTGVVNGTIDDSKLIRRDEDVTVHFEPELHYEIGRMVIDGKNVEVPADSTSYTFEFIQEAHSIQVYFKEIPSFAIETQVQNGTITATNKKVYRDENYTVHYEPRDNYRLAYMKVDGEWVMEIDTDHISSDYTFENIQKGHTMNVIYQWKYLPYAILAGAFGACIPVGLLYVAISRRRKKRKSEISKG